MSGNVIYIKPAISKIAIDRMINIDLNRLFVSDFRAIYESVFYHTLDIKVVKMNLKGLY